MNIVIRSLHTAACISLLKLSTRKCDLELNSLTCFPHYTSSKYIARNQIREMSCESHSFENTNDIDCDVYLHVPDSIQCSSDEYSENEDEAAGIYTQVCQYIIIS